MTPLSARFVALAFVGLCCVAPAGAALSSGEVHAWETQEITFQSAKGYANRRGFVRATPNGRAL